jgi:hypothetical protein
MRTLSILRSVSSAISCFFVISIDKLLESCNVLIAVSSSRIFPEDDDKIFKISSSISFNFRLLSDGRGKRMRSIIIQLKSYRYQLLSNSTDNISGADLSVEFDAVDTDTTSPISVMRKNSTMKQYSL